LGGLLGYEDERIEKLRELGVIEMPERTE